MREYRPPFRLCNLPEGDGLSLNWPSKLLAAALEDAPLVA